MRRIIIISYPGEEAGGVVSAGLDSSAACSCPAVGLADASSFFSSVSFEDSSFGAATGVDVAAAAAAAGAAAATGDGATGAEEADSHAAGVEAGFAAAGLAFGLLTITTTKLLSSIL